MKLLRLAVMKNKILKFSTFFLPLLFSFCFCFLVYSQFFQLFSIHSYRLWIFLIGTLIVSDLSLYFLYKKFLFSQLVKYTKREFLKLILICGFLSFFTFVWIPLPLKGLQTTKTLDIISENPQKEVNSTVCLIWFNHDFGDVSFSQLIKTGKWSLYEDKLCSSDQNASLSWSGKPGENATLEFLTGPNSQEIIVKWDHDERRISLFRSEKSQS